MNLRRTLLITPASDDDLVRKGRKTDADMFFLDLEDAIPSEEKVQARRSAIDILESGPEPEKSVTVRINGVDTPWWYSDVIETITAVGTVVDSVIIPKVYSPKQIHAVDLLLRQVESNAGLDPGDVGLIPQLESATGINNAIRIARSSDRLTGLLFGPGDYAASIGVGDAVEGTEVSRRWEYARSRLVNAAREVGIKAIDGMFPGTDNVDDFRRICQRVRALGFDGKVVVHPNQIQVANDIFTPNPQEVQRAQRIYDAYMQSGSEDQGPVKVNGQIIDEETFQMARKIVEKAIEAGELEDT